MNTTALPTPDGPAGAPAPETLALRLFGPFDARWGDRPLPRTRTRKEPWLLALLILRTGRRVDRSWLAETLWPESDPEQARRNLRRSLSDLRTALGPDAERLSAPTPGTVALDTTAAWVDVAEFDDALRRGSPEALGRAVALYRGPLLEGCDEEWAVGERLAREQDCLRALETLAAWRAEAGDTDGAASLLRRAVALGPLHESALRALMDALAAGGDRAAAEQAYHDLRRRLRRERNAEPDGATVALFRRIQAGELSSGPSHPASPSSDPSAPHLPRPRTSLVGREDDIRAVRIRLGRTRLVTLTGPGGIGKTRLALEAARREAPAWHSGTWLADLAPLSGPGLVARTVAQALGVRERAAQPLADTLADALGAERHLIVLDNCEHVRAECVALLRSLLPACPGLTVLATSREALDLPDEVIHRVEPLPVPPVRRRLDAGTVLSCDSARLFAARSRVPGEELLTGPDSAEALARICRRLDGIPLALELAAARTGVMTVEQIARRLEDRFRLLTGGTAPQTRQQTLRALVDWSWDLLGEDERLLFARLSVFADGWTLETAESVCAGEGLVEEDVLDVLARLEAKSLIRTGPRREVMRHGMLETLRQYAGERLATSGTEAVWRRRHGAHFLILAETAEAQLSGPEQSDWLATLDAEHDNLRAALAWSLAQTDGAADSLRLCASLGRFWQTRGHLSEGRDWCRRALAQPGGNTAPSRARAARTGGDLAFSQGDLIAAERLYAEGTGLAAAAGETALDALLRVRLGNVAAEQGDLDKAEALYERGLDSLRRFGDRAGVATALNAWGNLLYKRGDLSGARSLYEEGMALQQELGDRQAMAAGLGNLANVACEQRDWAEARARHAESLRLKRLLGDRAGVARTLFNLGNVELDAGDPAAAAPLYDDSLRLFRDLGDARSCVFVLEMAAGAKGCAPDALVTQRERATRLWGCAEALRAALRCPMPPHGVAPHQARMDTVRAALGELAWSRAWTAGGLLSLQEACEIILEEKPPTD